MSINPFDVNSSQLNIFDTICYISDVCAISEEKQELNDLFKDTSDKSNLNIFYKAVPLCVDNRRYFWGRGWVGL